MGKTAGTYTHPALVLGMFETGMGVGRSLGREGIRVFGFDHHRDIGFYSRYIKAEVCPHPIREPDKLLSKLKGFAASFTDKPVLYISSDDFLTFYTNFSEELKEHFLFNLSPAGLIRDISDKYSQYHLAKKAGVELPATFKIGNPVDLADCIPLLKFPVFIKAMDVNKWRSVIGGSTKGFVAADAAELSGKLGKVLEQGLEVIVQEIIPGPDTRHFKYCGYVGRNGNFLLEFTLRKIRQNPIRFGVGTVVESIGYPELMKEGRRFMEAIGFRGVGSAEFKLDERDQKLKLIELNPRYWQQNSLPTRCGMNFPLMDYLEVTGAQPEPVTTFRKGVKWVNRYTDFDSFLKYRRQGELNFSDWRKSLKGEKIYSDFAWDDLMPFLYEFRFGWKFFRLPWFLFRKLFR